MMEWKPYIGDRLIAEHPGGFYVIKPVTSGEKTPIFCPLCESIMTGVYDAEVYKKFGCCDRCAGAWVYPNMERWTSGWRPSAEEVRNICERVPNYVAQE